MTGKDDLTPDTAASDERVRAAIRTLAQFCIDNGYDAFTWTLRNGPNDPDGGVSDWIATIGPATERISGAV